MKVSAGRAGVILDTYVRALFDTGEVAEAVACEKKAPALSSEPETKAIMARTLTRYETEAAVR